MFFNPHCPDFSTVFDITNAPAQAISSPPFLFLQLSHFLPSFSIVFETTNNYETSILRQNFSYALPFPFRGCKKLKLKGRREKKPLNYIVLDS